MPRHVESYIAYPAIIPYSLLSFVGTALKWFVILLCVASVPFSLYRCYLAMTQGTHNSKPVHHAVLHGRPFSSAPKGQRP